MCKKESCVVGTAIVMAVAAMMFFPVIGIAGSLDPSAAPAPTMKTLDQIPPTWSQKLQCDTTACPRFQVVLDGAAVLDKETGLVWEKSPSSTTRAWVNTITYCYQLSLGGRGGWHLPTLNQLASLVDPSVSPGPTLPPGHPFTNVTTFYWSATTSASNAAVAWYVNFSNDDVDIADKIGLCRTWCVRGGESYDAY